MIDILGGLIIFLIGMILMLNAAFSDRATFGFFVALIGFLIVLAAVAEMIFGWVGL